MCLFDTLTTFAPNKAYPSETTHHSHNSKYDIKLYISDKGMNKSLRHQRLLYTKYKQCERMRAKTKQKQKKENDCILLTLSVDLEASPARRGRRSELISMEIDETLSDSPAESHAQRGGVPPSRPVHASLICVFFFPVSAASPLSSPLLSGDAWPSGGTTPVMVLSQRECNSEYLLISYPLQASPQ